MKRTLLLVCAVLLVASLAFAGPPKTYQVTGPVLELTHSASSTSSSLGISRCSGFATRRDASAANTQAPSNAPKPSSK